MTEEVNQPIDGMDINSTMISLDNDQTFLRIAEKYLGHDGLKGIRKKFAALQTIWKVGVTWY